MRSILLYTALVLAGGPGMQAGAQDALRAFTPTDLNMLARVSDPQVSPNGRYVVYVMRETDFDANRGRNDLWLVDLEADTPKPRRLTQHPANDGTPRWAPDGASIYFLSARAGSTQIWRLPMLGGEAVQITDYPLDVGTFKFSPRGDRLAARAMLEVPPRRRCGQLVELLVQEIENDAFEALTVHATLPRFPWGLRAAGTACFQHDAACF